MYQPESQWANVLNRRSLRASQAGFERSRPVAGSIGSHRKVSAVPKRNAARIPTRTQNGRAAGWPTSASAGRRRGAPGAGSSGGSAWALSETGRCSAGVVRATAQLARRGPGPGLAQAALEVVLASPAELRLGVGRVEDATPEVARPRIGVRRLGLRACDGAAQLPERVHGRRHAGADVVGPAALACGPREQRPDHVAD